MAEILIPELETLIKKVDDLTKQLGRIEAMLSEKHNKPYLTVPEVASELKFSGATIKTWINQGRRHPQTRKLVKLPCIKSEGGHYRVKRKDLEVFKEVFTTL